LPTTAENACRKPPVVLKSENFPEPEAGYDVPQSRKKSPTAEKQRWELTNRREEKLDRNSDTAFGTIFRIRKCCQRR
jgi:hypothetical protein